MAYYVYLLECADETYYVGLTKNLTNRMHEHRRGEVSPTRSRLPVELVHKEGFKDEKGAQEREVQLKKWSRAKKKALASGKTEDLANLYKKNFGEP